MAVNIPTITCVDAVPFTLDKPGGICTIVQYGKDKTLTMQILRILPFFKNLFSGAFQVLSHNRVVTLPRARDAGPIAKLSRRRFCCAAKPTRL